MYISVIQSDRPAYRQIFEQLSEQILSGALPAGEALPPIRAVASQTGVSVITVRSAWDLLEADGLIETRAGSGCYVASLSDDEKKERKSRLLPVSDFIRAAKKSGLTKDEVCGMINDAWDKE